MIADDLIPRAMGEMVEILRLDLTLSLLLAVVCGGGIGMERQLAGKPAGLRTNILICVGATLLGVVIFGDFPDRMTWAGIAIIVASGVVIAWREGVRRRR